MSVAYTPQATLALVSRCDLRPGAQPSYLTLSDSGAADWTCDPLAATAFASMREATRAAMRLPAALKAYGLPHRSEVLH
ncbi:MAG: hypothetical protein JSR98_11860 [Proteobacteria bacterium]|nr:hypothetical protein [Pseudomonadota bacterium]